MHGHTPIERGKPTRFGALVPLARTCAVQLTVDDALTYQEMVTTMDALGKVGLEVSLGGGADSKPVRVGAAADSITAPTLDDLRTQAPMRPPQGTLKNAPVVVVTTTQVLYQGAELGAPSDDTIAEKLAAALPGAPTDPALVLEADGNTSARTINQIVAAATRHGYSNLVFAVGTR